MSSSCLLIILMSSLRLTWSATLVELAQINMVGYKELGFVQNRQLSFTLLWPYYPRDLVGCGFQMSQISSTLRSNLQLCLKVYSNRRERGSARREGLFGGLASCNCHFSHLCGSLPACLFVHHIHATRRGLLIPSDCNYRQLCDVLGLLRIEPRSCTRTVSALFH